MLTTGVFPENSTEECKNAHRHIISFLRKMQYLCIDTSRLQATKEILSEQ